MKTLAKMTLVALMGLGAVSATTGTAMAQCRVGPGPIFGPRPIPGINGPFPIINGPFPIVEVQPYPFPRPVKPIVWPPKKQVSPNPRLIPGDWKNSKGAVVTISSQGTVSALALNFSGTIEVTGIDVAITYTSPASGRMTGQITQFDATGRPTRISLSGGVVLTRS